MDSSQAKYPRIFELMEKEHVTAKQLSAATGISQSNFTEWKKGRSNPKIDALIRISEYFSVPGFNYEGTLKPIINVLLGDHKETAETDMMISVAEFKAAKIKDLESQMTRMEESYKRRIEFLKNQIEIKDARIDKRDEMITKLIDTIIHHTLGQEIE